MICQYRPFNALDLEVVSGELHLRLPHPQVHLEIGAVEPRYPRRRPRCPLVIRRQGSAALKLRYSSGTTRYIQMNRGAYLSKGLVVFAYRSHFSIRTFTSLPLRSEMNSEEFRKAAHASIDESKSRHQPTILLLFKLTTSQSSTTTTQSKPVESSPMSPQATCASSSPPAHPNRARNGKQSRKTSNPR